MTKTGLEAAALAIGIKGDAAQKTAWAVDEPQEQTWVAIELQEQTQVAFKQQESRRWLLNCWT